MAGKNGSHVAEHGDIFFFCRPNVGAEEVVEVMHQLPDRTYDSMADVERGFGQIA